MSGSESGAWDSLLVDQSKAAAIRGLRATAVAFVGGASSSPVLVRPPLLQLEPGSLRLGSHHITTLPTPTALAVAIAIAACTCIM